MNDTPPPDTAPHGMQPDDSPELQALYQGFRDNHLNPLWTQTGNLMPVHPKPQAVPHVWKWSTLLPLAQASGRLVPVGRGGERRAIGLANPGLGGKAFVSPTLWAAIQYLGPRETAPEHRHSQNAFRFVVEGEGVWTVVNGDPVRMSRGDLLLTPGWCFHGHHNATDQPMAWIDGLDIPFGQQMDVGFFEFGADSVTDRSTPDLSRSERLWCHPGLRPLSGIADTVASPVGAYRWEHTDRALAEQLQLEDEGHPATWARATRRCATSIPPPAVTFCRPSAASSTACAKARRRQPGRRSARPCSRCSKGAAASSWAASPTTWTRATCSSSRHGYPGRWRPKRGLTCSGFPTHRSWSGSGSCAAAPAADARRPVLQSPR